MVAGSSGAYFYIADTIIQMDCYVPRDITSLHKGVLRRVRGGAHRAGRRALSFRQPEEG